MKLPLAVIFGVVLSAAFSECSVVREKRQLPAGNGQLISSIFQVPIMTLNAVHNLVQSGRIRVNQVTNYFVQRVPRITRLTSLANRVGVWGRNNAGQPQNKPTFNSKALVQSKKNH